MEKHTVLQGGFAEFPDSEAEVLSAPVLGRVVLEFLNLRLDAGSDIRASSDKLRDFRGKEVEQGIGSIPCGIAVSFG